jgi:hypothetical protein
MADSSSPPPADPKPGFFSRVRALLSRNATLWRVLLVAIAIHSISLYRYGRRFDNNLSGLICMGDRARFMSPEEMPEGMHYLKNCVGYDGQFFYFIARDPFIARDMHKRIDNPAYRYQRIMYPLLAALLAFGSVSRIPAMLVFVNIASIIIGTFFVALMFKKQRMSQWYALFYALLSGLLIASMRDLCGPTAMCFMVGGLYFFSEKRFFTSAAFIAIAILTRETVIALVPCLVIDGIFRKRSARAALSAILSPLPFIAWAWAITKRFGHPPWHGGTGNLGRPGIAMANHLRDVLFSVHRGQEEKVFLVLFVLTTAVCLGYALRQVFKSVDGLSLAFLGYAILPFLMTESVWIEPWSYGRVLVTSSVLLVVNFASSKDKAYLFPLTMSGFLYFAALSWLKIKF